MNKFIDTGEDDSIEYRQEDIAYMPHLYHIRWAKKLNNVLSKVFYTPFLYDEPSYQTGKSNKHEYIAKLLPKLRSEEINKVFFANLIEDFDYDFAKAGNVNEFYGILHSSNYLSCELHGNPMTAKYSEAYQGTCWVGDCGCASNNVPFGYERLERLGRRV